MENFVFQSATKIIFGKDTENQIGSEVSKNATKILLVHYGDQYIKNSGILDRVTASLKKAGVQYLELSGIKPNPVLGTVYQGIKICRENKIEFVLALGGGSVIDTAKAIAAGVLFPGDVWDLFLGKAKFDKAIPIGVIVTIPATGSEGSNGSVVTNEKTGYKLAIIDECLRPKFAILNPELTYTLPPYQTFCGAADIMSHVMERYFTQVTNVDLTDRLCEATLKTVIRNARILLTDPRNYHARAEIMWASTIAHNDLLTTGRIGDWGSHMIGMELSAIYDSTHGATLSAVTSSWARYVLKYNLNRFVQFAARIWNVEYDYDNPERAALEGIKEMENFFREVGLPVNLRELKIPDQTRFDEMAAKCTERGTVGCIKPLNKDDIFNILKLAW